MLRNWETFEKIENMIADLTKADQIELMLEIVDKMQENEKQNAIEAYNKKEEFYNQERQIHENNYKVLGEIWNSCQDLYIIEK